MCFHLPVTVLFFSATGKPPTSIPEDIGRTYFIRMKDIAELYLEIRRLIVVVSKSFFDLPPVDQSKSSST